MRRRFRAPGGGGTRRRGATGSPAQTGRAARTSSRAHAADQQRADSHPQAEAARSEPTPRRRTTGTARPSRPPRELLDQALAQRRSLLDDPQTTCLRLFHGAADGLDGCVLEQFGAALVVQIHAGRLAAEEADVRALCEAARARTGATAVYRKTYPRDRSFAPRTLDAQHRDPQPWLGAPTAAELPVREHGLTFLVRPYDGYSTGLFLEQRANRARLVRCAGGRRVLNLFAYTCGFSVAAARGGAVETVNVDIARKALEWGRRNFAANGLEASGHVFLCSDARAYLRRAARQARRFDLVILDPPSFARIKATGGVFALEDELEALLALALPVIAPGGSLLLASNHRGISIQRLRIALEQAAAAAGRSRASLAPGELPPDFAGDPEYSKSLWLELRN